jgi:hypothetical protein
MDNERDDTDFFRRPDERIFQELDWGQSVLIRRALLEVVCFACYPSMS